MSKTVAIVGDLIKELQEDPDYRRVWKDNIAMAFKDEYHWYLNNNELLKVDSSDVHQIANNAADNFLTLLCKDNDSSN